MEKAQYSVSTFLYIVFPVDEAIADMNKMDADEDGSISFDELQDVFAFLTMDNFSSFDDNGDDLLDQREFLVGVYGIEVD